MGLGFRVVVLLGAVEAPGGTVYPTQPARGHQLDPNALPEPRDVRIPGPSPEALFRGSDLKP